MAADGPGPRRRLGRRRPAHALDPDAQRDWRRARGAAERERAAHARGRWSSLGYRVRRRPARLIVPLVISLVVLAGVGAAVVAVSRGVGGGSGGDNLRYRLAAGDRLAWRGTIRIDGTTSEDGGAARPLALGATFRLDGTVDAADAAGSTIDARVSGFALSTGAQQVQGLPSDYRFTLTLDGDGGVVSAAVVGGSTGPTGAPGAAFPLRVEDLLSLGLIPTPRTDLGAGDRWDYAARLTSFGGKDTGAARDVRLAAQYEGGGQIVGFARVPVQAAQRDGADTLRYAANEEVRARLTVVDGRPGTVEVQRISAGRQEALVKGVATETVAQAQLALRLDPVAPAG